MAVVKKIVRNRFVVVRKDGKRIRIPLRHTPEAPASVYFGVRFKDGVSVFMPRKARIADGATRDLAELRKHACVVRGLKPAVSPGAKQEAFADADIVSVTTACVKCAREIPGCTGCAFGAAIQEEAAAAEKAKVETPPKAVAPAVKESK